MSASILGNENESESENKQESKQKIETKEIEGPPPDTTVLDRPTSSKKKKRRKRKKKSSSLKKKVIPPFEGLYEGETVDGLREGHGTVRWTNGDEYVGSFNAGYRSGQGKYVIEQQKRIYNGMWRRSKRHGKGKETFADASTYEGMYANDLFNGEGKRTTAAGTYDGFFELGMKHGEGRMLWVEARSSYNGHWKDGFFHGMGEYLGKDGTTYNGEWSK